MSQRIFAPLVPPAIADKRGRAFGATMERALNEPDFAKLLFERIDSVDDALLPFLIREFSIEEFCEPGMTAAAIRNLLKGSYEIHARKGFIDGVRAGLKRLGMEAQWTQWFESDPKGPPGTHRIKVYVGEHLFDAQKTLIDARVKRLADKMIDGTKRYSQEVFLSFGVLMDDRIGAASAARTRAASRNLCVLNWPEQPDPRLGATMAATHKRRPRTLAFLSAERAPPQAMLSAVATHRRVIRLHAAFEGLVA